MSHNIPFCWISPTSFTCECSGQWISSLVQGLWILLHQHWTLTETLRYLVTLSREGSCSSDLYSLGGEDVLSQLKTLDLGLGSSWVGQFASFPTSILPDLAPLLSRRRAGPTLMLSSAQASKDSSPAPPGEEMDQLYGSYTHHGASSPAHTSSGTLLLHARPQDLLSYSAQVRDRTCSPKCIRWQGVWLSIPCPRHCGWLSRTKPMRCRAMSPKFTAPSSWQGARSALLCLWHQGLPSHTAQVKGGASSPTPSSKSAVLCLSTRVSWSVSSRWRMWPTLLSLHHCYFREAEPALLYAQYWGQKPRAHSTRVSSLVLSQWGAGTVLEYA